LSDTLGSLDYRKLAEYIRGVIQDEFLTFLDKALITNPRFYYKAYEGYGFAASRSFKGVSSGSSVDILFHNPSGSGRIVNVVLVDVTGLAELYVEIYVGNTITSPGTEVTPLNLRPSTGISSVGKIYYGGTYTLGSMIYDMVCPGGSKQFAIGGALSLGEAVIMDEGVNFVMRITNASASSTDFSARAVWWEE